MWLIVTRFVVGIAHGEVSLPYIDLRNNLHGHQEYPAKLLELYWLIGALKSYHTCTTMFVGDVQFQR